MPYILDINNIAYYFSYNDLKSLLKTYFYKVAKVKNIKDDLLFQVSTDTNSEDINSKSLCKNKVAVNIFKENKSIDISTYKNPILVSLPPEICDPPCDPANCQSCVDGECVTNCSEEQCCNNGICGDCDSCEGTCVHEEAGGLWALTQHDCDVYDGTPIEEECRCNSPSFDLGRPPNPGETYTSNCYSWP
jgi:hypothetical protein